MNSEPEVDLLGELSPVPQRAHKQIPHPRSACCVAHQLSTRENLPLNSRQLSTRENREVSLEFSPTVHAGKPRGVSLEFSPTVHAGKPREVSLEITRIPLEITAISCWDPSMILLDRLISNLRMTSQQAQFSGLAFR